MITAGVELVLSVLETAEFERLPSPLVVAGSTFEFDAAARGTVYSHDLVVVALTSSAPSRLVRLLSGLSLTLDQVSSRRPVTLILLGEPLDAATLSELERQARVLTIHSEQPTEEEVRTAIAILLPLDIPASAHQGPDVLAELRAVVGGREWSDEHQSLAATAGLGSDAVRAFLREYIEEGAGVVDDEAPE